MLFKEKKFTCMVLFCLLLLLFTRSATAQETQPSAEDPITQIYYLMETPVSSSEYTQQELQARAIGTIILSCIPTNYTFECNWNANIIGDTFSYVDLTLSFQKSSLGEWNTVNTGTFKYPINLPVRSIGDQLTRDLTFYGTGNYRGLLTGSVTLTQSGKTYPTPATSSTWELPY